MHRAAQQARRRLWAVAASLLAVLVVSGCVRAAADLSAAGVNAAAPSAAPSASVAAARKATAAPAARSAPTSRPARPAVDACAANVHAKLVRVSIADQRAWFCAHRRTVLTVPVTTGAAERAGRATPTGWFRIEGRARNTTLLPSDGSSYRVRYWVPFSGTEYGFHDASWQRFPLGSRDYRWQGSHGCVHMSLAAMRFLYGWGTAGTPVQILR
jgi:hypothetical protein